MESFAAPVILDNPLTETVDLTRYAVPASLDRTFTPLAVVTLTVATVGVGAVASTAIDNPADVDAFPAASVSVTEMLHTPSAKVPSVQVFDEIVQVTLADPVLVAVTTAVPEKEPETLILGVLSEVMLSESEAPALSEVESKSGVEGVLGAVVSTVIALAPAILFEPLGTVRSTMMFPAASVGAEVNAYELTVRSALVSPAATVYVPVSVLFTALCVRTTVFPLSNVTVIDADAVTGSEIVAVMLIVEPALYAPSDVVDEKLVIVGRDVSITIALFAPSDPEAPKPGRVKTPVFPAASLIDPPLSAKADVLA
jgi:hypothetical protein